MEPFVLTLSIRTHVLASRVTLEHIARQVRVCDCIHQYGKHSMQFLFDMMFVHASFCSLYVNVCMS